MTGKDIMVHKKLASTFKSRAPVIRYQSHRQLALADFDWPFPPALDESNRWVKMSQCIPWDELAEAYCEGLCATQGRPTKDARLVIGAVIIKRKRCLSDREAVAQIQTPLSAVLRGATWVPDGSAVCPIPVCRDTQAHGAVGV